jgi:hypothetical protein
LRKEIARFDLLTFGECYFYQLAIDPRLHRDRIERLHRAETGEIDRDIAPPRRGDRHRDRRRGRRCCRRGEFGCRMMLPANVTAPCGNQNCQACEQVTALAEDRLLERFQRIIHNSNIGRR